MIFGVLLLRRTKNISFRCSFDGMNFEFRIRSDREVTHSAALDIFLIKHFLQRLDLRVCVSVCVGSCRDSD